MAKKTTSTRAATKHNKDVVENALEHTVHQDDNIIPPPDQLKAYQEIDNRFAQFFMETTKSEQEHRHSMNKKSINLIETIEKTAKGIEYTRLFLAFFIILVFALLSYLLMEKGEYIIGGLFSASTLGLIVNAFLRIPFKKESEENNNKEKK